MVGQVIALPGALDNLDAGTVLLPVSWKGTVAQYAGRLHRLYENRRAVTVYDFLDDAVPVLVRMFERRRKGYEALGCTVTGGAPSADPFFDEQA